MIEGSARLTDEDEGLLALRKAFQIEISCYHFYHRLSKVLEDPSARDFFKNLSQIEREQADELNRLFHLHLGEEIFQDTDWVLPQPFFEDVPVFAVGDRRGLLDFAIHLEQKILNFFLVRTTGLPQGTALQLYLDLAEKEKRHIALLEAAKNR